MLVDSRPQTMRRGYGDDEETGAFPGERVFKSHVDVRYAFAPANERPDALIVAFSAAHERDEPPRYYTTRVLRALACHRLFILDDHGPDGGTHPRPSWYLGPNRSADVPAAVDELIQAIAQETQLERGRIFTCGASKGGWAALFFAARFGAAHAVAGEPQTLLGQHLLQDGTWDIAEHVAGGTSPADGEYLDELLFEALKNSPTPPAIHLFCGRGSPYYEHDVLPLAKFLDEHAIPCELTLADFSEHVPDLGRRFPAYLTQRLTSLIESEQDDHQTEAQALTTAAAPAPPSSPPDRDPR